jgi:cysteine desulfurase
MLYFDHAASTPPHDDVIRTLTEVMAQHYANPSSLHRSGAMAKRLIDRARALAAQLFETEDAEWRFTSGGTESNNLAVLGAARRFRGRGNHIVTTRVEHPSVFEAFRALENEGFRVTYLDANETGHITARQVEAALTDDTILVSMMHVNNEVGSVQPIEAVGKLLKERSRTLFHVDGVQSAGKLPIRLKEWGIDLFAMSAHKLRGPRGAGWLYVRSGLELEAILHGGEQEEGLRPGTENVPAIVAAAKAFRMSIESQPERLARMAALRERLTRGIAVIPELVLSGPSDGEDNGVRQMAPHIVHFCYPGMRPEVMVHSLEKHGIIVSTKSACSSKDDKPSRVLLAMGRDAACAASGIRISLGDEHREEHIEVLLARLSAVVQKLKPLIGKGT